MNQVPISPDRKDNVRPLTNQVPMRRGLFACMIVLLAMGGFSAHAHVLPTISGTLRTLDGGPVRGCVELQFLNGDVARGATAARATGEYEIPEVTPGTYLLSFFECPEFDSRRYLSRWYPTSPTADGAVPIRVEAARSVTGIDGLLPVGGAIRGRVRVVGDAPVEGMDVIAYDDVGQASRGGVTIDDGSFEVKPLEPGEYFLRAADSGRYFPDDPYYHGVTWQPSRPGPNGGISVGGFGQIVVAPVTTVPQHGIPRKRGEAFVARAGESSEIGRVLALDTGVVETATVASTSSEWGEPIGAYSSVAVQLGRVVSRVNVKDRPVHSGIMVDGTYVPIVARGIEVLAEADCVSTFASVRVASLTVGGSVVVVNDLIGRRSVEVAPGVSIAIDVRGPASEGFRGVRVVALRVESGLETVEIAAAEAGLAGCPADDAD